MSKEDIHVPEFQKLLKGIMPETPLGKIVSIRLEKDKKAISKMSMEHKKMRKEWQQFLRSKQPSKLTLLDKKNQVKNIQKAMEQMFSKGGT